MVERVKIGNVGTAGGTMKVSRRGVAVDSATGSSVLLSSTDNSGKPRYMRKIDSKTSSIGLNTSIGPQGGLVPVLGDQGTAYLPLCVVIEDQTSNPLLTTSGNFYDPDSDDYHTYLGVDDLSDVEENQLETMNLYTFSNKYKASTNTYASDGDKHIIRTACFTAGSADHGIEMANWNEFNSTNQRWSTSTIGSHITSGGGLGRRIEFRKPSDGSSNNNLFIYRSNGSYYTLPKANMGGAVPTNCKAATFYIPCGYGYMTSAWFGF
jgi:hypothetical protein